MPVLGEIKKGKEIGKSYYAKFIWLACDFCGKERWVELNKTHSTTPRCSSCAKIGTHMSVKTKEALIKANKGNTREKSTSWKGGVYHNSNGYISIMLSPDDFFHPMADVKDYVLEHRLVMAKYLGRCLQKWEVVHHKNGIKDDNRIENLELATSNQNHIAEHSRGYRDGYAKGLQDGHLKQIQILQQRIIELEAQLVVKELVKV
jgi:hypothetical protein